MLRHQGRSRRDKHNLQLAALFSLVAGLVNITGFLAVRYLTTNVTGHFAYFAEAVTLRNLPSMLGFGLFILSFFAGAFVSHSLMEISGRRGAPYPYAIPVLCEMVILLFAALMPLFRTPGLREFFACALLFAMGLQNALVTTVSNAAVRTTHLTGLFTDIGIDLSQLLFSYIPSDRQVVKAKIKLRGTIALCFFVGCMVGGIIYPYLHQHTFFLAIAVLIAALTKDKVRITMIRIRRRYL